MSHFTVGVIANKLSDVDNMLAPYQENNMGDCPKEYLEFISTRDENYEVWDKDTFDRIKLEDGTLVDTCDERFMVKTVKDGISRTEFIVPEELERVKVPRKEIYKTFKEYMEDYCGYTLDEDMNDYGYWENPNAKWDWYEVGGRWNNILLVKDEVDLDEVGGPSWCNIESSSKNAPEGYKWVNACKLKDLELDLMMKGAYDRAIRFWELIVEEQEPTNESEKEDVKWNLYKSEYFTSRYSSKEEYAKWQSMFNTYAMLDDNGWHSKGDMGWFGCDSSTGDSEREFIEEFNNVLKDPANQEKILVIVDCHI